MPAKSLQKKQSRKSHRDYEHVMPMSSVARSVKNATAEQVAITKDAVSLLQLIHDALMFSIFIHAVAGARNASNRRVMENHMTYALSKKNSSQDIPSPKYLKLVDRAGVFLRAIFGLSIAQSVVKQLKHLSQGFIEELFDAAAKKASFKTKKHVGVKHILYVFSSVYLRHFGDAESNISLSDKGDSTLSFGPVSVRVSRVSKARPSKDGEHDKMHMVYESKLAMKNYQPASRDVMKGLLSIKKKGTDDAAAGDAKKPVAKKSAAKGNKSKSDSPSPLKKGQFDAMVARRAATVAKKWPNYHMVADSDEFLDDMLQ